MALGALAGLRPGAARRAAAAVCGGPGDGDPIILFIPGFTKRAFAVTNGITKPKYFNAQRDSFTKQGRTVLYLNTPSLGGGDYRAFAGNVDHGFAFSTKLFDSENDTIGPNAWVIRQVLLHFAAEGRKVSIVSHSKGGQDVLHALVGYDDSETLWPTIAGWVAFTTNWFESDFPIGDDDDDGVIEPGDEGSGGGRPPTCTVGRRPLPPFFQDCNTPRTLCPRDSCDSAYADFDFAIVEDHRSRQEYMLEHEDRITRLMTCVPTISAFASYVPGPGNSGALDLFNRGIRQSSEDGATPALRCGANDGLVPARAGQLPGATVVQLLTDTGGPALCGVDHLAPAVDVILADNRFWRASFRVRETERYLAGVESAGPLAVAGGDRVVECESHQGVEVMLDGGQSTTVAGRTIDHYEWLDGACDLIATGIQPVVTLPLGTHPITLRITDSCGASDEDEVVISVVDTRPPAIEVTWFRPALWPPDHAMHHVATLVAFDVCDPSPSLTVRISSNEAIDGTGDGRTEPDWSVLPRADGRVDVWVRAERSGRGSGRRYAIHAEATDASGNRAAIERTVAVAHDRGTRRSDRRRR